MAKRRKSLKLFALLACLFIFGLTQHSRDSQAQDEAALQPTRPGLTIEIFDATIPSDRKPIVTFRITDDAGVGLDRIGLFTAGPVTLRFVIARIDPGNRHYTAYTTRMRTGAFGTVLQAWHESDGTFADLGGGKYTYQFKTVLPENFDKTVTHTVAIGGRRDLSEFNGGVHFATAVFDFVPAGGLVTTVRDIVRTEACNQCHDPLAAHSGGFWREVRACVLCHQPQSTDHETGNPIDAPIMFHKIHMGADLPSVQAGTPYVIEDEDFSEVEFPQDIRNCTKCHTGTTQTENYITSLSRAACGSCHDDIDFTKGAGQPGGHLGGVQTDDTRCSRCHIPDSGAEFDLSVTGSHTIPEKSRQLPGVNFQIVNVTNTAPGQKPTVTFNIKDNAGNPIAPAAMNRLRLTLAGPTTDYAQFWQEDARGASGPDASGNFSYTFTKGIPSDAGGTFAVGIEGFRNITLRPGPADPGDPANMVRDVGFNMVKYIAVTDPTPVPRRKAVELANCNVCHDRLHGRGASEVHGGVRNNTEYCVMCHNANHTDEEDRPAAAMPPETVHFKVLVHKIHRGHEQESQYTVYSGRGAFQTNEVHFPGDLRNCTKCHVPGANQLPLPAGVLPTRMPRGQFRGLPDPTPPITAACTACHDGLSTAAHAATMTAPVGEACATCHAEGKDFAVSRVHAR